MNNIKSVKEKYLDEISPESIKYFCNIIKKLSPSILTEIELQTRLKGFSLDNFKESITPEHLIYSFILEHEYIAKFVDKVETGLVELQKITCYTIAKNKISELIKNTNILIGSEAHNQKEELILFPEISKIINYDISDMVKTEHENIRKLQAEFKYLLLHINPINFQEFREKAIKVGKNYCKNLKKEVNKENYLLYPLALKVIKEANLWNEMKRQCNLIGSCSFIIP